MEVGRALVDRARDQGVDELDRGSARRGALADVVDRSLVLVRLLLDDADVELCAVDAPDRAVQVRRGRDGEADVEAEREAAIVGRDDGRRVGDSDEPDSP